MNHRNVTPILFVDRIEPALDFWQKLGWKKDVEVLHGESLGFVILSDGEHELMLQTNSSLAADLPLVSALEPRCAVYIDVSSLRTALEASAGARVLVRERETTYGAREAWVVDPAGVVVGFAEHAGER
jgi:uncharacterized glyoxalase superfamily protein PhnB